ncbi:MAG: DNA replication and repair protein RecF [Ignavibacteria bacterium]|nr:DNA replication and repair protein RecF [Ignavibacteria bacterium]
MKIIKIILRNFRNYGEEEIIFNGKFNFISGNNGQGKTNILEAISFSALGKSFLGASETDCVKFGKEEFLIESVFENDLENMDKITVGYNSIARLKAIYKNKEKVSAFSSEIFGRYPMVILSPKSLDITHGNPSDRRRFFDILISQASRLYLDYLKELVKILKQKNALLKNYTVLKKYAKAEFTDMLNSYNEKLSDISSKIIFKRINFLKEFEKYFEKNFSFLSSEGHKSRITYYSEIFETELNGSEETSIDDIKECMSRVLNEKSEEEISRAVSLAGPQRDDYIFRLKKRDGDYFDIKHFASQGEHKTCIVALKLSEYDYLKHKKSTDPILLLDDVLSELDESRVSSIISHLKDYGQIFLTTTDKGYLENLKVFYGEEEISVFEIENGTLINRHEAHRHKIEN